jgi:hypothetical protein
MWTMASSVVDKYSDLKDLFYARARKYVEADYIKGYGEHIISVAHCQAHTLLASYEMRMMYFPRAWVSTGSAVRLAQMYVTVPHFPQRSRNKADQTAGLHYTGWTVKAWR